MRSKDRLSNYASGELAYLWEAYVYETMTKCGLNFFLCHVKDEEVKKLLLQSANSSKKRIHNIIQFFEKASYPVPQGFTEKHIVKDAPRLFSDVLYLEFLLQLIKLEVFMPALQMFFYDAIRNSLDLKLNITKIAKEKGTFIPHPKIPIPDHTSFINDEKFLAGWFGDKRPLTAMEITHLIHNAKRNGIGQAVITGFSQVAQSKDIRKYFERGRDIAGKSFKIFSKLLHESYLPSSSKLWTSEVTDSTHPPFSDRLMIYFITTLIASGMRSYGTAMAVSQRRDLGVMYSRLVVEVAQYANEGAKIMIQNGWLERPPMAINRKDLAK